MSWFRLGLHALTVITFFFGTNSNNFLKHKNLHFLRHYKPKTIETHCEK